MALRVAPGSPRAVVALIAHIPRSGARGRQIEMKTATFRGTVDEHGKLKLFNDGAFRVILGRLKGKWVVVTVRDDKPKRSSNQNAYYWGVVLKTISDELGNNTNDDVHQHVRWMFLRTEPDPENGRALATVRSTTSLKTDEMEDFLDRVRMWAASDHGIVIPLPNEVPDSLICQV